MVSAICSMEYANSLCKYIFIPWSTQGKSGGGGGRSKLNGKVEKGRIKKKIINTISHTFSNFIFLYVIYLYEYKYLENIKKHNIFKYNNKITKIKLNLKIN